MSDFGKGIPLASGFDLGAKKPLDSREIVETIEERDEHILKNRAYEGMTVYVKQEKKVYRYDGNEWVDCTNVNVDDIDLSNYYNKKEIDSIVENLDIDSENCSYVGESIPENDEVIWFSDGITTVGDEITYDNPLIKELFACINSLQFQIQKLQEEVEYLKLHGGGSSGSNKPEDDVIIGNYLVLENGYGLLLEDGNNILLENDKNDNNKPVDTILLENGFELLLENGENILLESSEDSNTFTNGILLENGFELLLENGENILLESA